MPTTSNFGWTTPADTDLVKDGAAAIRTLGNGIDTSLVDLKGGTTGQILSKATNTDLDYTWITPNVGDITEVQAGTGISVASGTGPIPVITNTVATAFDAAGDLVYGTGADTFTKLSIGTAGKVLTVNSGATAPEWASLPAGGSPMTLISTTTLSGTTTTISSISTSYNTLFLLFVNVTNSAGDTLAVRINGDSGNNYYNSLYRLYAGTVTYGANAAASRIVSAYGVPGSGSSTSGMLQLSKYDSTEYVYFGTTYSGTSSGQLDQVSGRYDGTAAASSISITSASGNFAGTVYLFGA